jgi:hypothetical protein
MRTHVGVSMPLGAHADIETTWFLYGHLLLEDNFTDSYIGCITILDIVTCAMICIFDITNK